jgi:hypothetical protein
MDTINRAGHFHKQFVEQKHHKINYVTGTGKTNGLSHMA